MNIGPCKECGFDPAMAMLEDDSKDKNIAELERKLARAVEIGKFFIRQVELFSRDEYNTTLDAKETEMQKELNELT